MRTSRIAVIIATALAAATSMLATSASASAQARSATAAALASSPALTSSPVALVMLHGFADTCQAAFQETAAQAKTGESGPSDTTTLSYFNSHGWHNDIDLVGYYPSTYDTVGSGQCTDNASDDTTAGSKCSPLNPGGPSIFDEPVSYLACEVAWYIYDTYTVHGWSVDVLAHSMGGLITRAAIAYSGVNSDYPPPIGVTRVVTIATPHGGLGGQYLADAQQQYGSNITEVEDMTAGSSFLGKLPGDPQGALGTWWGLTGGSVGAACASTGAGLFSCLAQGDAIGGLEQVSFHDGDGVIQASSMMAMDADMKVLYGHVEGVMPSSDPTNGTSTTVITDNYTAGIGLAGEYVHEYGCAHWGIFSGCSSPPYYLNDATSGTTQAWVCTGTCDSADVNGPGAFDDLNVSGPPVTTQYSLAEIATNMLPAPASPPVYDVPNEGALSAGWQARGGASGPLGAATGWWAPEASGQSEQDFANGTLYAYSSGGSCDGCYAVYGAANADYKSLGGPTGFLGVPVKDEVPDGNGGQVVTFSATSCTGQAATGYGAAIYAGSGLPAAEIQGCIYQAWLKTNGGLTGTLGYPISNETAIPGGKVSYFTGPNEAGCNYPYPVINGTTARGAIYWDTHNPGSATVYAVQGCAFAAFRHWGEISGPLGYPAGSASTQGNELVQPFQGGTLYDLNGTVTNSLWVTGHAAHAGNDYPYETIGQFGHQSQGMDAWREYYGQCDSFSAWKAYENLAGAAAQHPSIVPAPGWKPSNASVSPVDQETMGPGGGWGNADAWAGFFSGLGYAVNNTPAPGAIAYWANGVADTQDGLAANAAGLPGSSTGHVGYVTDVYPDGSITVEMYNMRENGEYSVVHMAYGTGYTDASFGQGSYSVPWPNSFIHAGDGPSGAASPAEPAVGVVSAGYPSQVKVIGPGSSSSQFSLGNVWYLRAGHGEVGNEEWTHANGATAVSTATYTPSGLAANACYRIDAFVPDNYSDNPVAVYTVADINGTHLAAANETVFTNDWAELGVFEANGTGALTVKLDDRGTTGGYVAADAMRFWRQASCGSYGDVSPIIMPGTTNGTWSADSGHGFLATMKSAATSGSLTGTNANAGWLPTTLVPGACYEVSAYVPDSYSDNNAARYQVIDSYYGTFWPQVNENAFTNQFAPMGGFTASSSGQISVALTNMGPSGQYVAADAVAFTLDPLCEGPTQTGFGPVYASDTIGPGSSPASFVTAQPWYLRLGHGYAYHELWTHDNGSAASSTATWTFSGAANACYSVQVYVPDNFASNPQAHYAVSTSLVSDPTLTVNQAGYTNQFVRLSSIRTGSNGVVRVQLTDQGPTTDSGGNPLYTAADAVEFVMNGSGC